MCNLFILVIINLIKKLKMSNYFNKLLMQDYKILIFGRYGQLGSIFDKYLAKNLNVLQLDSKEANFLYSKDIPKIIKEFNPKYIINTSAYTDVNGAESEPDIANEINCNAVKMLAEASKINNSTLIHYSTDYVFDGKKKTRYNSSDIPNPKNVYGKTKFSGEKSIIESGCDFFIFRISWLVSEFGKNFVKIILSKLKEKNDFSVIDDQIGSPISSHLVAEITCKIILNSINTKKIFHVSTKGEISWYHFALYIYQIAKNINKNININPIKTSEYPSKTFRPKNSLFDLSEIETVIKSPMPFWKDDITPIIKKLDNNS